MTVYIEKVFIVNFIIDLLLLITVSYVLKRNVSSNRLIIGALSGSFSIFLLFVNVNGFVLFICKYFVAVFMCLVTYGFKNIKYSLKNIIYLYIVSLFLGGFFNFLNDNFKYYNFSILFIIIVSPFILYMYYKEMRELKCNYNNYYKVNLFLKRGLVSVSAFLDSGNKLCDPYLNRPVILLKRSVFNDDLSKYSNLVVPYVTIREKSFLTCIIVDKVEVEGIGYKNRVLVGLIDDNINIDNVDLILNTRLLEEIHV